MRIKMEEKMIKTTDGARAPRDTDEHGRRGAENLNERDDGQ